jgi:xanthine dehydrogenase/oxidase
MALPPPCTAPPQTRNVVPASASSTTSPPSHDAQKLGALISSVYNTSEIVFYLNGRRTVLANPDPQWTLLDYLRSRPGLRGTKLGCGEGGCGACTVVMQVGEQSRLPARRVNHVSINACLFPLLGCEGKHIITVEGIGSVTSPHPLQERMAKMHGSQCGFCTPGIVMSLYALVRNAWDPEAGVFRLSERDVELQGALNGNLCRCTGYKTILEAAKTFVTEDLKGKVTDAGGEGIEGGIEEDMGSLAVSQASTSLPSCGRPGGCCRDNKGSTCGSSANQDRPSPSESLEKTNSHSSGDGSTDENAPSPGTSLSSQGSLKSNPVLELGGSLTTKPNHYEFKPYEPGTELIFPPLLWKHERKPICYGDSSMLWFRPTTLAQLLEIKSIYPPAKIVSGASEVAIEQRFKNADWPVMVYVGDIDELKRLKSPTADATDAEWQGLNEVVLPANVPLTEVERICKAARMHLGKRGQVLGALRKQLRYFGGRQIRNVATLAGNIATASPISDAFPVLMASEAMVTIGRLDKATGAVSEEHVPLSNFVKGYRRTTLTEEVQDGVLTAVRIPLPASNSQEQEVIKAYKQSKRKEDDIAIVTACFRVRLDNTGHVEDAVLAYGGMAPTTRLATHTQAALRGVTWSDHSALEKALESLQKELWLPFDVPGGMAQYRTTLACSLFLRFWHESLRDLGLSVESAADVSELEHSLSSGTQDMAAVPADASTRNASTMGKPVPHLSSLAQTTGQAEYVDDIPPQADELFCGLVLSTRAHARIISVDWSPALESPGVVGHMDHRTLSSPDLNMWGSIKHDEPFFAVDTVDSHGQVIGVVLADTQLRARTAAKRVKIEYEDLPALITIDQAIAAGSFFPYGKELRKGDSALKQDLNGRFAACDRVFEGTTRLGGQEQFYLETNAALAIPKSEDGQMDVWSSTQNT